MNFLWFCDLTYFSPDYPASFVLYLAPEWPSRFFSTLWPYSSNLKFLIKSELSNLISLLFPLVLPSTCPSTLQ